MGDSKYNTDSYCLSNSSLLYNKIIIGLRGFALMDMGIKKCRLDSLIRGHPCHMATFLGKRQPCDKAIKAIK